MRIGNIYLPPTSGVDVLSNPPRGEAAARNRARPPADDTSDLLALSAGVSLRAALDGADSGRQALIDKLQQAWNAGAYRPDTGRIADKLLDSGFDPLDPEVP